MGEKFDPYHKWLGIPLKDQPPNHYRLLGIELLESDRDVINAAANRLMGYLKELAVGDEAAHSQRLLNEIARVRICLLNPEKKREYDRELRDQLAARKPPPQAATPSPPERPAPSLPPPRLVEPPPSFQLSGTSSPAAPRSRRTGTPRPGDRSANRPGTVDRKRTETAVGGAEGLPDFSGLAALAGKPAHEPAAGIKIVVEAGEKQDDGQLSKDESPPANEQPSNEQRPNERRRSEQKLPIRLILLALLIVGGLGVAAAVLFWLAGDPPPSETQIERGDSSISTPPVVVLDIAPADLDETVELRLDGARQVVSAEAFYFVAPGRHTLVFSRDGYETVTIETGDLIDGQEEKIRLKWKKLAADPTASSPDASLPDGSGVPDEDMLPEVEPMPEGDPLLDIGPLPEIDPAAGTSAATDSEPLVPPEIPLMDGTEDSTPPPLGSLGDNGFESTAVSGFTGGYGRRVGFWPLDGDVQDASGQAHATKLNEAGTYDEGRVKQALRFAPTQQMTVAEPMIESSSELSLAFWLRLDQIPAVSAPVFDGGGFQLFLLGGYPRFEVDSVQPQPGPNTDETTQGFRLIDLSQHLEQWVHIAVVYCSSMRQVHFYLNGRHEGFQRYATPAIVRMPKLAVGNFSGCLDQLQVFDYRLSGADVKAILEDTFVPLASAPEFPDGKLVCETWNDVPQGGLRRQLEYSMLRPADVRNDLTDQLSTIASPSEGTHLSRIRGFLYPPEKGEYVFRLFGSGNATLHLQRLSPEDNTLEEIAVNRQGKSVDSSSLPLEAGRPYYFEILHHFDGTSGGTLRLDSHGPSTPDDSFATIPLDYIAGYGSQD